MFTLLVGCPKQLYVGVALKQWIQLVDESHYVNYLPDTSYMYLLYALMYWGRGDPPSSTAGFSCIQSISVAFERYVPYSIA